MTAHRRASQPWASQPEITILPSDAATVKSLPTWSERPLDKTLILISLCAVIALGLLEICSGPQLATRLVLSVCYQIAMRTGVPVLYDLPSSWRGWYSLEIGVEITTAITLGFLVWLLFALVYDAAGILVGLVPSSVTSIVTLTFRFHLHSYALLIAVPVVIVQAVIAARILDRRWYEQEAERTTRRFKKRAAATNLRRRIPQPLPASDFAVVTGGGAYSRTRLDERQLQRHTTSRGPTRAKQIDDHDLNLTMSANF